MQGYSHALTGAAGWLAISSTATLPLHGLNPSWGGNLPLSANLLNTTSEVSLVGAIMCAGAALAPDIDHHNGTIAHSLPPVSQPMCEMVESISGGHRHATHSLVGVFGFVALTWLASLVTISVDGRTVALGAGIVAVLLVAFAIKGLRIPLGGRLLGTFLGPWLVSLGTAGLATYYLDYQWTWLPLAVGLGALIHCLGDALTIQGVPWLWPWNPKPPKGLQGTVLSPLWQRNGYFRVPVLGETSSFREAIFAAILALYVIGSLFSIVSQMA